jgi:acyl carrier protein
MEVSTTSTFEAVKAVVVETLGIEDRAASLTPDAALLGSVPELDSLAVLELVLSLERRFDIEIDGEDVTAELFETLASLTEYVDGKLG